MKKLYTFKFALIASAMISLCIACDNEPAQEPNTDPDTNQDAGDGDDTKPTGFAAVELSNPTADGFTITVDIVDYKGNYTIIPVTQEEIDDAGSVETYVEWYLEDDIATYGTDYSVVDNAYVFSGDCVFNMSEAWMLDPATAFKAIVVGVKGDGTYAEVTTDIVVSEEITTLEGSGDNTGSEDAEYPSNIELATADFGAIEISNVTSTEFDFSIQPADDEMPYLLFAFTEEEYNTQFTTDEDRILAIYATYSYFASADGYSFAAYIEESSLPGLYEDTYTEMDPNTKYYIVAFGIDLATYQPVTALEVESVTTLSASASSESRCGAAISRVAAKRVFNRIGRRF